MCLASYMSFGFVNVGQGRLEGNTGLDRKNESSRAIVPTNHASNYYNEALV